MHSETAANSGCGRFTVHPASHVTTAESRPSYDFGSGRSRAGDRCDNRRPEWLNSQWNVKSNLIKRLHFICQKFPFIFNKLEFRFFPS